MDNQTTFEQQSADTNVNNTPTPVTNSNAPKPQRSHGLAKKLLAGLLALLVVLVAAGSGYMIRDNQAKPQLASLAALQAELAEANKGTYPLPEGAIKVTDCIPNMGAHYVTKDSHPEYGPFFMVNKENRVIGVEYMASGDMYTDVDIPNLPIPVQILQKSSPAYDMKIDHIEMSRWPEGHKGLTRDHIDVHLFTISPEQVKNVCN